MTTQRSGSSMPKVRTITAFVRLDRDQYREQITAALAVLRKGKAAFETRGYEVQTIRITTQPLGELVSGLSDADVLAFLEKLDGLCAQENFSLNVGPAMLRDADDPRFMRLLAEALSKFSNLAGSALIATEDGIHPNVIRQAAVLVRYVADHSARSRGNFNFAVSAMLQPYAPYFPGSYHVGSGNRFAVGLESANVVEDVFQRTHENPASLSELTKELTRYAKAVEAVGQKIAAETGWEYLGVDPTPVPMGDVSIGAAVETYTGARFGSSGTMTAALAITSAVKAVSAKQVGYAGLMLPVMEDKLLAQRWAEGAYNIDSLLAYSAVCGTGLDTVPLPGNVSEEQLARIFNDVAALAWKWRKPLSARLLPVRGKGAGDRTAFSNPHLFETLLRPLP